MKKTLLVLSAALLLLTILACGPKRYRITCETGFVESYPSSAAAGETVEFTLLCVTDGYLEASVSGVDEVEYLNEADCRFVMPDHDVEISVTFVSDELAGA